jgi:hypothetical protein
MPAAAVPGITCTRLNCGRVSCLLQVPEADSSSWAALGSLQVTADKLEVYIALTANHRSTAVTPCSMHALLPQHLN